MTPPDREAELHPTARGLSHITSICFLTEQWAASGPTISDTISALSETLDSVEDSLNSLHHIAAKLAEWDAIGMEEIDEVHYLAL
jgi:hypothetical protein